MTERETLQLAGKALGYTVEENGTDINGKSWYWVVEIGDAWNPIIDQADSDRMACALNICTTFYRDCAGCVTTENMYFVGAEQRVPHDSTIEGRRAAVRQARMLVAVEIGRGK